MKACLAILASWAMAGCSLLIESGANRAKDASASDDALTADVVAPDSESGDADGSECPPNYQPALSSCFRPVSTAMTWADAEADCEGDGAGSHLAIISSADENSHVNSLLLGDTSWLGLRVTAAGSFAWITGTPTAFDAWDEGEPSGEIACGVVELGVWQDRLCDEVARYVCEHDGDDVIFPN